MDGEKDVKQERKKKEFPEFLFLFFLFVARSDVLRDREDNMEKDKTIFPLISSWISQTRKSSFWQFSTKLCFFVSQNCEFVL